MVEQEQAIVPVEDRGDWRARVFLLGGAIGTVLGLLSAYLYVQAAEQRYAGGEEPPEAPGAKDAVRLGVSLLSIIRTITEWGSR